MSLETSNTEEHSHLSSERQFSTFWVANRLYGIDVTRVQEIVRPMAMTSIPLVPSYVRGLINLRGQVATAIGLKELFEIESEVEGENMNVVCNCQGNLLALQVKDIGDVVEVGDNYYEPTPQTIPLGIRRFLSGVYKTPNSLLSIVDVDSVNNFLSEQNSENRSQ